MSAISFIYNLSAKSLTLNEQEKVHYGIPITPSRPSLPEAFNPEFKKVTNQVTGFFNNIFKEVRLFGSHAADDIVANIGTPSPIAGSAAISSPSRDTPSHQLQKKQSDQQEDFELQLALALSLSENQPTMDEYLETEISVGNALEVTIPKHAESPAISLVDLADSAAFQQEGSTNN